jgi:hypothetical protein
MTARSVEELWRIAAFDQSIHARVAWELLASWPIPVREDADLGYRFFYYAAFGPPPAKVYKLWPPSWIVHIATDGTVSGLRRITPQDAGLSVAEGEPFATFSWPSSWTVEEADRKREELLKSYDAAVSAWVTDVPASAGGKPVADFRRRFLELTQSALLPCYRTLGNAFFPWASV